MPIPPPPPLNPLKNPLIRVLLTTLLCSLSYTLGFYKPNNPTPTPILQPPLCLHLKNLTTHQNPPQSLNFEPHHTLIPPPDRPTTQQFFPFCPKNFTNYCPCQDPYRESQFSTERFFHRERHCPNIGKNLRCLVRNPVGYRRPFPWPKSRDNSWLNNVPFPRLSVSKKKQNWVRLEGDRHVFPGGGTSFTKGVKGILTKSMGSCR